MRISFKCPRCGGEIEADSGAVGTRMPCRHCAAGVEVPQKTVGPGTTLGGFKIERLLGVGGMGEVYLARQLSLDRHVALKILPGSLHLDKTRADRFLNEVLLLARLEHPNIVTAHEAGEDGGVLFMAMAYVKGEALDRKLSRDGPLREKEALALTAKIANALAYAWNEHRLLHRDIKPSNILLDPRGEPKLADLGLSRTVEKQAEAAAGSELVVGTPNYMSPEQAEGRELDFRADMYSLGATLYHMVTGQLPFAGEDAMEILRRQVSERLPDPRVYHPDLSEPCVQLMELMLAKNPAHRHASWEALIGDLGRVRAGRSPTGEPPAQGDSVMLRARDVRALADARKLTLKAGDLERLRTAPAARKRSPAGPIVLVAALLLAALGAVVILRRHPAGPPPGRSVGSTAGEHGQPEQQRREKLGASVAAAESFFREHPAEFAAALDRFSKLAGPAKGTPFADRVEAGAKTVTEARDRAATGVRAAIAKRVAARVEAGDLDGALAIAQAADTPFEDQLRPFRTQLVDAIRARRAKQQDRQARTETAFARLRAETADALLQMDFAGARAALAQAAANQLLAAHTGEIAHFAGLVDQVSKLPEQVLASFLDDVGKTVTVRLGSGAESWEIRGVEGTDILARRSVGAGSVARTIPYDALSPAEKYRRLGAGETPARCVMRGLVAFQAGKTPVALKNFEASGDPLGAALASELEAQAQRAAEVAAGKSYESLARLAGQDPAADPAEAARGVRRTGYAPADVAALHEAAAAFREQYGATECGRRAAPVVDAIAAAATMPREVDEARLRRAMTDLAAANPGVGDLGSAFVNGTDGVALNLSGNPALVDLGPLAKLPLSRLNLAGCGVRDLAPLAGMPLAQLDLTDCPVRDLAPLLGAPVEDLRMARCPVADIAPLKGMPLEHLDLTGTQVDTLTPLVGAPLRELVLDGAPIKDLRALLGMPLRELNVANCGQVADLGPLKGAPLHKVVLDATAVRDLSPLHGSTLEALSLAGCPELRNLRPLEGLPLRDLNIQTCPVSDVRPLAGLPLEQLQLVNLPKLTDIGPLAGLPLRYLWLYGSNISDIGPLAKDPIVQLDLRYTPVADLSPCGSMPLQSLFLEGCSRVRSLDALRQCRQLRIVVIPSPATPTDPLRDHPGLEQIGLTPDRLVPVARYWRLKDEGASPFGP